MNVARSRLIKLLNSELLLGNKLPGRGSSAIPSKINPGDDTGHGTICARAQDFYGNKLSIVFELSRSRTVCLLLPMFRGTDVW